MGGSFVPLKLKVAESGQPVWGSNWADYIQTAFEHRTAKADMTLTRTEVRGKLV